MSKVFSGVFSLITLIGLTACSAEMQTPKEERVTQGETLNWAKAHNDLPLFPTAEAYKRATTGNSECWSLWVAAPIDDIDKFYSTALNSPNWSKWELWKSDGNADGPPDRTYLLTDGKTEYTVTLHPQDNRVLTLLLTCPVDPGDGIHVQHFVNVRKSSSPSPVHPA